MNFVNPLTMHSKYTITYFDNRVVAIANEIRGLPEKFI